MSAKKSYFDSESVLLMGRVCDEAWRELVDATLFISIDSEEKARRCIASKVLEAVAAGERDPVRLKALAFDGFAEKSEVARDNGGGSTGAPNAVPQSATLSDLTKEPTDGGSSAK
jgi:hypothetical protein